MATANLPAECPNCGTSRVSSPEKFDAGQTLCTQCGGQMHDCEMTMERDEHLASRYHRASKLLFAEQDWGHSYVCPDCTETFHGESKTGPRTCPTCEELQTAETVPSPEGYQDQGLDSSDVALLDL